MNLEAALQEAVTQALANTLPGLLAQHLGKVPYPNSEPECEDDTVLTMPELAAYLRVGRNAAYALCHQDPPPFPVRKIAGRLVVAKWAVRRWLDGQQGTAPAPVRPWVLRPAALEEESA